MSPPSQMVCSCSGQLRGFLREAVRPARGTDSCCDSLQRPPVVPGALHLPLLPRWCLLVWVSSRGGLGVSPRPPNTLLLRSRVGPCMGQVRFNALKRVRTTDNV